MEELKLERVRNRLLYCPICLDEFDDPRWLPCRHTFCFKCLEQLKDNSSSSYIQCPECRCQTSTKENFPVNFLIMSLKEEMEASTSPKLCDVCHKQYHFVKFYCEKCSLDLCDSCTPDHSLFVHTSSHKDFLIKKADFPKLKIKIPCPVHLDEVQQMYCNNCKQTLCIQCYYASHKKHQTMPLKQRSEIFKKDIKQKLTSFCRLSHEVDVCLLELDIVEENLIHMYDSTIREMNQEKALLLEAIECKITQHVKHLRSWQKEVCASIQSQRIMMQNYCNNIDRCKDIFVKIRDDQIPTPAINSFDRYLKLIKSEYEQLRSPCLIKSPIFNKGWRLKIEPFLWIFLGWPSFTPFHLKLYPLWRNLAWTFKPLKLFLFLMTLISVIFAICKLIYNVFESGLSFDTGFAIAIEVYLLFSLLLCLF